VSPLQQAKHSSIVGVQGLVCVVCFYCCLRSTALCVQVEIDPQLKELLEGPFRNLECFREEQARRRAAAQEVSTKHWLAAARITCSDKPVSRAY
jgi:hypothetical protein